MTTPRALRIADIAIRRDEHGRLSLNDLHRAAGGEDRHSPNRWTRTDTFDALQNALTPDMAFAPVASQRGGSAAGTYVVEDLVYAYAMWISPQFHLQVIRAYRAATEAPRAAPAVALPNFEDPAEAAEAWAHQFRGRTRAEQRAQALEAEVLTQAPLVAALQRLASTKSTFSIRDACGPLGMRESDLRAYLVEKGWLYRDRPSGEWRGASEPRTRGYLEHKVRPFEKANGERDSRVQVRVTASGLAKLGEMRERAAQASESVVGAIEHCNRILN